PKGYPATIFWSWSNAALARKMSATPPPHPPPSLHADDSFEDNAPPRMRPARHISSPYAMIDGHLRPHRRDLEGRRRGRLGRSATRNQSGVSMAPNDTRASR